MERGPEETVGGGGATPSRPRGAPGGGRVLPPVLLPMGDGYGTLAAARALGRAGVRVTMAEWRLLPPARWSRFVARTESCPDAEAAPDRFLAWLLERGARQPGEVLLATNDDLAWLFARHRKALCRHYLLDVPDGDVVYRVLNKWRLGEACREVGLATPECWVPRDEADLARIARDARFPLLVKPQTQVYLAPHRKGTVVRSADALAGAYREFRAGTRHAADLVAHDPGVSAPMLQAFVDLAGKGVYNLSGYADATGGVFAVLAARKLLQRPRLTGVGICFEEAEVLPDLAERLAALCRAVGYHGVFEAEFVPTPAGYSLIDFNPRFYGQMGFDVERGLDLPMLSYLSAIGDDGGLHARAAATAEAARSAGGGRVYCNRVQLWVFLLLLRMTGRIDRDEVRKWRDWVSDHRDRITDAVISRDDVFPGLADALATVYHHVVHARSAWRAAREG